MVHPGSSRLLGSPSIPQPFSPLPTKAIAGINSFYGIYIDGDQNPPAELCVDVPQVQPGPTGWVYLFDNVANNSGLFDGIIDLGVACGSPRSGAIQRMSLTLVLTTRLRSRMPILRMASFCSVRRAALWIPRTAPRRCHVQPPTVTHFSFPRCCNSPASNIIAGSYHSWQELEYSKAPPPPPRFPERWPARVDGRSRPESALQPRTAQAPRFVTIQQLSPTEAARLQGDCTLVATSIVTYSLVGLGMGAR